MKVKNRKLPEDETIQGVPIILKPELRDVFPIFASMLDIKSFMKLAMTSQGMYKRCMEDKAIRINVDEKIVRGWDPNDFRFGSSIVSEKLTSAYLSTLKNMRCTINLRTLEISNFWVTTFMIESARRYLAEIGVKRIEKLFLNDKFSEWDAVIPFIKDFHVNILAISGLRVSLPVLRSFLQLNLREFSYDVPVSVDLLFEVNSPIPKLSFAGIDDIPKDKFMQILWMIQSGSLTQVSFNIRAVDWRAYNGLPFYQKDALPDDRPLLFRGIINRGEIHEYWFLHWQGGVTKCLLNENSRTLKVFKCEPSDLPVALREDKDIVKDLTEMRSGVSCLLKHFNRLFCDLKRGSPECSLRFLPVSASKEPLPTERPLFFRTSEMSFSQLDEEDNLTECVWENARVTWKPFMPRGCLGFAHPPLAKYLFWKLLKDQTDSPFNLVCKSQEEFESWFEDYESLDYDYTGPLPDERPLIFSGQDLQTRFVLVNGVWFKIRFTSEKVFVGQYKNWQGSSKITDQNIKKILEKNSLQNMSSYCPDAYVNVRVSLKTFRDGLKLFESNESDNVPLMERSMRHINGVLTEECWYIFEGVIRKVVWSEGRLVKTPGDLRECPMEILKTLFKEFATQGQSPDSIFLKLRQFQSCLKQFTVVPFDYSGTLKIEFPLVFTKKEIYHTCDDEDSKCQCSDVIIRVRFLWEDMNSTHCSWGGEEAQKISFFTMPDRRENLPPAMKTKEYLQMLLETDYDSDTQYEWFGEIDDFLAFFDGFKKFPFDFKGRLPKERPLAFENNSIANEPIRFFLREDNSVVKCKWSAMTRKEAHLSLPRSKRLAPRATWKFL